MQLMQDGSTDNCHNIYYTLLVMDSNWPHKLGHT